MSAPPVHHTDALRARLIASLPALRPRLHRFCARMCGSALDGEDVVQETLGQAFERLEILADESRLEPWLFRIAHHKCVDLLRRERRWKETVPIDEANDAELPASTQVHEVPVDDALATLVGALPPKERASVLLKDVLDYPLDEVAAIVDSTVGGVKAALHRGRGKLRTLHETPVGARSVVPLDESARRLLDEYVVCFNRHDWDALNRLIRRDARLEVVGFDAGTMLDVGRNYFTNYMALREPWRLGLVRVDGEPVVVRLRSVGGAWQPFTAVRLTWEQGQVVAIRDYVHVEYLLEGALVEDLHRGDVS